MKKFVSMAMVAAMTASMVPATAFAGDDMDATAKVVNVWKVRDTEVDKDTPIKDKGVKDNAPELQIKLTDVSAQGTGAATSAEFTVTLDGAEFTSTDAANIKSKGTVKESDGTVKGSITSAKLVDKDELEITVAVDTDKYDSFANGDVISIDLFSKLDKAKDAFVSVESGDFNISNDGEDLVYVDVMDEGITASIKKLAKVAEEEFTTLEKDLKIESNVGNFVKGQEIEVKLSNGFEFTKATKDVDGDDTAKGFSLTRDDEDTLIIKILKNGLDEIVIDAKDIEIEAVSAKEGAVATLTVKAKANGKVGFNATTKVEVMEVTDYTVIMSVDEDEDLPVIYSGVNKKNTGITDDSDHLSLEVTIEESFPGAWSMRQGFNLELPEGVYVTDVNVTDVEGLTKEKEAVTVTKTSLKTDFEDAYREGDHKGFEFEKRVFDDVDTILNKDEAKMSFELELVADPTFYGDVTLKLTGDLIDEQEVTIATFQPIAVVEAEQNDMKIDYRYTAIPSNIVVKETEAGLWAKGSEFWMAIEKGEMMSFEEDAVFETTGGLEIDDFEDDRLFKSIGMDAGKDEVNAIGFEVDEESDEAATVTISNLSLFMQRNVPAGPYDLIAGGHAFGAYLDQELFAPDCEIIGCDGTTTTTCKKDNDCIISDVEDFSDVVKEAFVNVVTAGREQDDASFTTKVVVPVGESYIVSGETTVELDVPAYVSEAGYTMLPVRAVAKALGINNNNVMWDGATKTVTILYGQRIITMVAGQKAINVNGSVIPASAAVEIVDGRTFLPMRDLATALGVTDIAWDASTKTATLNGGVVAE